jgi:hypothetical protein
MHKIKEFYLAALTVKIKIQKVRLFQFQNKVHCTYTSTSGVGGGLQWKIPQKGLDKSLKV